MLLQFVLYTPLLYSVHKRPAIYHFVLLGVPGFNTAGADCAGALSTVLLKFLVQFHKSDVLVTVLLKYPLLQLTTLVRVSIYK